MDVATCKHIMARVVEELAESAMHASGVGGSLATSTTGRDGMVSVPMKSTRNTGRVCSKRATLWLMRSKLLRGCCQGNNNAATHPLSEHLRHRSLPGTETLRLHFSSRNGTRTARQEYDLGGRHMGMGVDMGGGWKGKRGMGVDMDMGGG
jgi:hypothetical protein